MNHLPFIVAAYAVGILTPAAYALAAITRARSAHRRLLQAEALRA